MSLHAGRKRRGAAKTDVTKPVPQRPSKRTKIAPSIPTTAPATINHVPTDVLDVLVFGAGDCGELGLGPAQNEALSPLANPFLHAATGSALHVVQLDCGGMHTIALTNKNQIVTWGVNDNGALGRPTAWEGGMCDIDEDGSGSGSGGEGNSDSDSDGDINPRESTPTPIPSTSFPPNTTFVQVAAGDSCSLALTDTGLVYGWGTFKAPNGDEMFYYDINGKLVKTQTTPVLISGLAGITQIACGANHALALDGNKGLLWTWGCGDQNQLGHRTVTSRRSTSAPGGDLGRRLTPQPVNIRDVQYVAAGEYHSFAVDRRGNVWGWGFNGFGETAGDPRVAGKDGAPLLLPYPMKIRALCGQGVVCLDGGVHHSAALGIKFSAEQLADPALIRHDDRGRPRICLRPILVGGGSGSEPTLLGPTRFVACGTDHTIFIARDGAVYATGFNGQGQLGLGEGADEDVYVAQRISGKEVQNISLTWAGAGGQFSAVAGPHAESQSASQ